MLIKSVLGPLERPTTPQRGTWALSLHAPQAFILQQQTLPGDALPRGTGISSDPDHLSLSACTCTQHTDVWTRLGLGERAQGRGRSGLDRAF